MLALVTLDCVRVVDTLVGGTCETLPERNGMLSAAITTGALTDA